MWKWNVQRVYTFDEKVMPKDEHGNYHVFIMDNSCESVKCNKK